MTIELTDFAKCNLRGEKVLFVMKNFQIQHVHLGGRIAVLLQLSLHSAIARSTQPVAFSELE